MRFPFYNKAEFSLIHINDVYLNAPISYRESSTKFRERARLPIFNIFFHVVTYYTKLDIACENL